MYHIKTLDEGLATFKALGSEIRIEIIKLLLNHKGMNMNELATHLNITNGALTSHIKKLEDCGIITIASESTGHGNQKICKVHLDKILIEFSTGEEMENVFESEIQIGHYSDYKILPTCGLASVDSLIGEVDDTRYFAHPDRINSEILWFTQGFIEYNVPNFVPSGHQIVGITISVELGSEAPGINENWPSDVYFHLNGTCLGTWTSPGDFGEVKGMFTPDWWYPNWNQYGLLKLIEVNERGSFIDGLKISDVTISSFQLDHRSPIKFRFSIPDTAKNIGGLTIFGKHFGNYNQDIKVRIHYSPINKL